MIGLVCIDVDGTLVGRTGTIDPAVWELAARARARGIRLAVCTGRPGFGRAREWALRLDPDGWHAFHNGASVMHVASGRAHDIALPAVAVVHAITRARANQRTLELYTGTDYVVERDSQRSRDHAALLGVDYRVRPLQSLAGAPVRAQWLIDHGELDAVLAEPHPGLDAVQSTSPMMPDTMFVNLTARGVGKDTGVRRIAEGCGVALDDVMFVGDSANDRSAMRVVGHAVAMGNAEPELHALARTVVGDVDAGGLAAALELALRG